MKIVYRILIASAIACVSAVASGQNLDPTVVVSREYEGKLMEVHKPKLDMAVPDSVLRFDLDFDYSVSDSPYKGAYEFKPYLLDMKPEPVARQAGRLYVNAGAGYQLRPELDVVWSPQFKKNLFRMDVYASHKSYIGQYWDIGPMESAGGIVLDRAGKDFFHNGMDMLNRAGLDARLDWKNGALRVDAGYYGLLQQDKSEVGVYRSFNAFDASLALGSKGLLAQYFTYSLTADYRLADDALTSPGAISLTENFFSAEAMVKSGLKKYGRSFIAIEADYDMVSYSGCFNTYASVVSAAPKYIWEANSVWDINVGVKFAKVFRANEPGEMYKNKIQAVYPDVKVAFVKIPFFRPYVSATGGPELETYSSLVASDRRVNATYAGLYPGMLDVADQSICAEVGFEGTICDYFTYVLRGGYSRYAYAPLSAVYYNEGRYCPGIAYQSYSKAYAALELRLDTERVDADASAGYSYFMTGEQFCAILPAAYTADASVVYNWMKRVYAGVSCEAVSARKGYIHNGVAEGASLAKAAIPGYVDLGVNVEYVLNRKFSVWAKGWNLLGMTVQRSVFYAERGPGFTVGVCFNM